MLNDDKEIRELRRDTYFIQQDMVDKIYQMEYKRDYEALSIIYGQQMEVQENEWQRIIHLNNLNNIEYYDNKIFGSDDLLNQVKDLESRIYANNDINLKNLIYDCLNDNKEWEDIFPYFVQFNNMEFDEYEKYLEKYQYHIGKPEINKQLIISFRIL